MEMSENIKQSFKELDLEKAKILSLGNTVMITTNNVSITGVVTESPHFVVPRVTSNFASTHTLDGTWWAKIDNITISLKDYNVIPNTYNSHSIKLIKQKVI